MKILNFLEKKDSDLEGCCEKFAKLWVALHSCTSKATLAICGAGLATVSVWCCGKQLLEGHQELPGVLPATVSQRFQAGGEVKKKERLASIIKTRDILNLEFLIWTLAEQKLDGRIINQKKTIAYFQYVLS